MKMKELERTAMQIRALYSERMPMSLQAEQYTLVQHELAGDPMSLVDLLREKQDCERVFSCENPPRYHAIIAESSLVRMPGGERALIREQAYHLLGLIEQHP